MTAGPAPFHLSLTATDLAAQLAFYADVLRCRPVRTSSGFADVDFFGSQLTFHERPTRAARFDELHFGAIIPLEDFRAIEQRLRAAGTTFLVPPQQQSAGTPDERWKLAFVDPSGHAIELKAYVNPARLLLRGERPATA